MTHRPQTLLLGWVALTALAGCSSSAAKQPSAGPTSTTATAASATSLAGSASGGIPGCSTLASLTVSDKVWSNGCRRDDGTFVPETTSPCKNGRTLLAISDGKPDRVLYGYEGDPKPTDASNSSSDPAYGLAVRGCTG